MPASGRWEGDELVLEQVAMATRCALRLPLRDGCEPASLEAAGRTALAVFSAVEATCTRFRPESPLMALNRTPDRWHKAPPLLLAAIVEAQRAHDRTGGRVDPRVLRSLLDLGYDRTLPFGREEVRLVGRPATRAPRVHGGAFRPRFRPATGEVRLGPEPIDLGGIGKGLAVRWAGEALARVTPDFLVEAGGDGTCAGEAPGGGPWLVGIEDPRSGPGTSEPLGVLALTDRSFATSSTRLRRWSADGRPVHHLIDPRTGRPGGKGMAAVTVVGNDPARAEAWSKALFLAGHREAGPLARRRGIAAFWVEKEGSVHHTREMERYLQWQRS